MNEGLSGWYGLLMMLIVAGGALLVVSVLGCAALRLMLKDDVYYPEEG